MTSPSSRASSARRPPSSLPRRGAIAARVRGGLFAIAACASVAGSAVADEALVEATRDEGPETQRSVFLERLSRGALGRATDVVVRRGVPDATPVGTRAAARVRAAIYLETLERELGAVRSFHRIEEAPADHTWLGFTFREDAPPQPEAEPEVGWYHAEFAYASGLPIRLAATEDYVTSLRVGFPNGSAEARRHRRDVTRALFDAVEDAGL